jgi:hypothetical protein
MEHNNIFSPRMKKSSDQKEFKELRRLLSSKGIISEKVIHTIWSILRKM